MKSLTPVCTKCGEESIIANAGLMNNIPYFYCRTCKDEVMGELNPCERKKKTKVDPEFHKQLLREFDEMVDDERYQDLLMDLDEWYQKKYPKGGTEL